MKKIKLTESQMALLKIMRRKKALMRTLDRRPDRALEKSYSRLFAPLNPKKMRDIPEFVRKLLQEMKLENARIARRMDRLEQQFRNCLHDQRLSHARARKILDKFE